MTQYSNPFDVAQSTWFQMKPYQKSPYDSRATFQHIGIDMAHIKYVSAGATIATGLYTFDVELQSGHWNKTIKFEFDRKLDLIKGHREFCRAYKQIEEFDYNANLLTKKTAGDATAEEV